ncbi:helix-turn-helix domain-containing protein [Pedobacter panaciterrae]|uniref:Helix-turn-helix domain-containing protein n=1 Tax=Pedobacter panaciterrae TaxID=363849 RepID=A0ABU8NIN2_9SPHI
MENLIRFETIEDYNVFANHQTLHPLVSVLDISNVTPQKPVSSYYNFYAVFLKDTVCGELVYGRSNYDYQEGSVVFIGPGQIVSVQTTEEVYVPKGYGLIFHADLLHGTPLGRAIDHYSFFGYNSNEALHISEEERQTLMECLLKIGKEIKQPADDHSNKLIVSNLELFLTYCERFYQRQFSTRQEHNEGIVEKFETILNQYFLSDEPQLHGTPSVAYCADKLNLSANYFGDLVKRETGMTAQEIILKKIITIAKERVFDLSKSVTQIANDMGFKYPQHFTRLFKSQVGLTPNKYRNSK